MQQISRSGSTPRDTSLTHIVKGCMVMLAMCAPFAVHAQSAACVPGSGTDYQVGTGTGQLATLDLVPWDKLKAGDTVRIFYKDTPYYGKFMISGNGTAAAPIRVCGVKNATGQRPVIDAKGAISRKGLAYGNILHETRSIIVVKPLSTSAWTAYPTYVQIDGLELRGANPSNTFTDSTGTVRPYETFGACIWVDRGQNITIADNIIHDCTNGLYSKSTNDGDFAVTKNLLISGNYIYGNGVVGDEHEHNVYMESVNITYEFNRFEAMRAGALGNAIKDRSAGTVIRYNYISGGAHSMDLVEAEDFYTYLSSVPAYLTAYRSAYVYGNVIVKNGGTGSFIHYGGDHYGSTPGSNWGEPLYRQGTLYFYNNTVSVTGTGGQLFQLSTTLENAQAWNNVFNFASTVTYPSLRAASSVNTTYWTAGGTMTMGKNWGTSTLADSDPWHPITGTVTGWNNLIKGTSLPVDATTFTPLSGSAVVDAAQANLSAVSSYPVNAQIDVTTFTGKTRSVAGSAADIGAIELGGAGASTGSATGSTTTASTTTTAPSTSTSTTTTTGSTTTSTSGTTSTASTSTTTSTTSSSTSTTTSGTTSSTTTSTTPTVAGTCVPSGLGTDYQVGPGTGQLATLDLVPWDQLKAGDTVRIFYKDTPYYGKFMISGNGTVAAPIRVCGVKSSTGKRPIIDGQNAISRKGLAYGNILHETRSIIVVKPLSTAAWTAYPTNVKIDGLELRGANPANSFTDSTGTVRKYDAFGACIWLERGQNITLSDNSIHDCTNGVFSKSTNDGDFAVTKNIMLAGNLIYSNGLVGDVHTHNVYMQSVNIIYEHNRFEPLRAGALGNAIKDRSVGSVVRYNFINGGAHSIDFVEAEDFYTIAQSYPAYRVAFAYGNIITKNGGTGSVIHYGGDHYYSTPGATWGEPIFRKGTLYFYNNTVTVTGTSGQLFQLSTTDEKAEVWNNVFHFASTVTYPSLRATSDVNTAYWTPGGTMNLGKNWGIANLADSDPSHPVPGTVTGWANVIKGSTQPFDSNYTPLSNSALVNVGQAALAAAVNNPVQKQLDMTIFGMNPRTVFGSGSDLGAVERMSN